MGGTIDSAERQKIVNGFLTAMKSADVVGFPTAYRLPRFLGISPQYVKTTTSLMDTKLSVVFSGMRMLVEQNAFAAEPWWTSEFCHYALARDTFLSKLFDAARSVVLVTCFDIPEGHFFDRPNITLVRTPPPPNRAHIGTAAFGGKSFPMVRDDIQDTMCAHAGPGVLVMACAGFAGKSILHRAKDLGSVAVDYGSAIDIMLGHRTRAPDWCARF